MMASSVIVLGLVRTPLQSFLPVLEAPPARQPRVLLPAHRMSLALPSCAASGFWTTAVAGGCTGLLGQLGFQALFERSSDPVLNRAAGNTAHSLVAAAYCLFATVFGVAGWCFSTFGCTSTAAGRVLAPLGCVRWLGAFAFGIIALWDIPTCFAVKELRKPSFLLHHFAMAAVGGLGAYYCPTYYGLFFLGVVEASSVPLSVYEGLERASEIAGEGTSAAEEERCARLKRWRDAAQAVATAAFLFTRLYLFTRVTFFEFWPDALAVLPTMAAGGARNTAPRRGPARARRSDRVSLRLLRIGPLLAGSLRRLCGASVLLVRPDRAAGVCRQVAGSERGGVNLPGTCEIVHSFRSL